MSNQATTKIHSNHPSAYNEELEICENCGEEIGMTGFAGFDELHDSCRERIIRAYCNRPGLVTS
jgi:hypothetical protein